MARRSRVSGRASRRMFTRSAVRVHPKNVSPRPMRGGIRM